MVPQQQKQHLLNLNYVFHFFIAVFFLFSSNWFSPVDALNIGVQAIDATVSVVCSKFPLNLIYDRSSFISICIYVTSLDFLISLISLLVIVLFLLMNISNIYIELHRVKLAVENVSRTSVQVHIYIYICIH